MLARVTGTAQLVRRAVKVTRAGAHHVNDGQPGAWDAELTISGLGDERRAELVDAMAANTGGSKLEPRGDGLLRLHGQADGFSLATAAAVAVSNFHKMLTAAGLDAGELLAARVTLDLRPADRPAAVKRPTGARGALARTAGQVAHGLGLAVSDMSDVGARQDHGDRSYNVDGNLSAMNTAELVALGAPQDGNVRLRISAERVGTGLGALLLVVTKLADTLRLAPAAAGLSLVAVPVSPAA